MTAEHSNSRKARADTREYARVRRAMVAAATELMAGNGYRKFRLEQLADKVGYNRATIYRYFDSKQDLVAAVMLSLMQEITSDIIGETAGNLVSQDSFTEVLYGIITRLRTEPRYAIAMDARNIETFARLCRQFFSEITTASLDRFLVGHPAGSILKPDISLMEAADWLMHQIISYGFLGISGDSPEQQKAHLKKMVVSVILK